nr:hypothetical protein [Chitinophaga pinensis]
MVVSVSETREDGQLLLADNQNWSAERIDSAMNSGKEKYVRVKDPVPVLITYYTAWVDEAGKLQFREDIYDHDTYMAGKLLLTPDNISS